MQAVRWQNEGQTIEAMLYLPPDASASHRVPLVLQVHGGPTSAYWERYDPFAQMLVGEGWAVLMPNPRGSTGYGHAFAAANKNDLGGADYRDLMAGVDYVIKNFPIDPSRLALAGYSYGGEMAGFAVGKTDRFKAIVSGAPVTDQFSEYGTENGSWYDRWFYGKPWENFESAWRQSPLSGASHAKTPFLLIQGDADLSDPAGQSQEMYRALRQVGAPVELVMYPREGHGTLAGGFYGRPSREPWHGFDARRRMLEMFRKAFSQSR
jgi:dipeptidyl aminopeptidase/acylaminoacyl peptidase